MLKLVANFKIVHVSILSCDIFEQGAKNRDVPLPIAEIENVPINGFLRADLKGTVECGVGDHDAEIGIKDQNGVPSGLDDSVRIGAAIDRAMLIVRKSSRREPQNSVADNHVGIWRNEVDVIGPDLDSVRGLGYGNFGARKNFFERTVVTRVERLQKDIGHAGGFREIGKQGRESFQAAGGGADTYDGENLIERGTRRR